MTQPPAGHTRSTARSSDAPAPRLVVVGGLTVDSILHADGSRSLGRAGGNTLWASAAIAAWGESVAIVAARGEDYPDAALAGLAGAGVDTSAVRRLPGRHPLRISYAYDERGERVQPVPPDRRAALPASERGWFADSTVAGRRAAGADPAPDWIPEHWLGAVRGWHLPLVPLATHRALVARLAGHGILQADAPNRSELSGFGDLAETLPLLDAFLPSMSDVAVFAPGTPPGAAHAAALAAGARTVALKLGADGVLVGGRHPVRLAPPPAGPPLVDATGAGDAFCGGFLVGLLRDGDPVEAARHGVASASVAIATSDPVALARTPRETMERIRTEVTG
ncbi:MAG: carbohydrate kinase family protein [Microbacteriaceae bacterium]